MARLVDVGHCTALDFREYPGVWTCPFCHVWAQVAASTLHGVDRKYHPANSGKLLRKWKLLQQVWSLRYEWSKAVWHGCGFFAAVGHHLLMQHLTDHKSLTLCLCRHLCITTYLYHHWCCNLGAVILYTPRGCGVTSAWMWTQKLQVLPEISVSSSPILMCCSVLSQQRGGSFENSCAGELQGGNNISSVHEEQWYIPHWLTANISLHILNLLLEWVVFFNDTRVVQWVDSELFTYMAAQISVHQGKRPSSVVLSTRGWEFGVGWDRAGQSNDIFVPQILLCGWSCSCDPLCTAV